MDAQLVNAAVKIKLKIIQLHKAKTKLEQDLTRLQSKMTPEEYGEYAKRMTQ